MLQVTLSARSEDLDHIEEILLTLGAVSITCRDAHQGAMETPVLEPAPGETPLWPEMIVSALFADTTDSRLLQAGLQANSVTRQYSEEELVDRDWSRVWMDEFKPMRFGSRLWVCPSWCEPPQPNAVNLLLDPGLAFGSGTHPTTSLCLEWLDGHDVTDKHLIDYGCGSGILTLAALKLGAAHVTAVDIDPQALIATQNNLDNNSISPTRYTLEKPAALEQAHYDIVLANILSGILIRLSPSLSSLVDGAGTIVMSGILEEQANDVASSYQNEFRVTQPSTKDGWVLLEGQRHS